MEAQARLLDVLRQLPQEPRLGLFSHIKQVYVY